MGTRADLIAGIAAEVGLGQRFSTGPSILDHHAHDTSRLPHSMPDAVAFPETEAEVQAVVRACAARGVPVTPYGVGSSMEGHAIPVRGGVSLDTSRMSRIVEILPQDQLAVVQPGVTRKRLNEELRATGLMFSVDPGADASLGGMASTRGSGTTAVRYGTMRDNVLGLRVVLPDGTAIKTGSRARKSSTGYDLTHLFVGAEGTLGVITELTVRLHPIPEAVTSAVCPFPDVRSAVEAVIAIIQYGIPVARIEFLDEVAIGGTNAYSGLGNKLAPTLFFEFHGTEAWVAEQAELAGAVAAEHGGEDFRWSADADERERLWQARHDILWATKAIQPGCELVTGDLCVPISRLADAILAARADIDASWLTGQIIGHVGDGNFHTAYLIRPGNAEDLAEAERLDDRLTETVLALGGTASGEHGLGYSKLRFMRAEHGDAAVETMKRIKTALDPGGIMNPGKMGDAG